MIHKTFQGAVVKSVSGTWHLYKNRLEDGLCLTECNRAIKFKEVHLNFDGLVSGRNPKPCGGCNWDGMGIGNGAGWNGGWQDGS